MSTVIDSKTEASIVETILSVVFQTLAYGAFAVLAIFLTQSSQRWQYALGLTAFMFALATAFWGVTVAHLVDLVHQLEGGTKATGFDLEDAFDLANAVIFINSLAIAVGVIVWRARVHWKGKNRIGVKIAVVFWILTVVAVIATIIVRVFLIIIVVKGKTVPPAGIDAIHVAQAAAVVLAILANLTSTVLIFIQRSKSRRSTLDNHLKGALGVLAVLVETGVLYVIALILGLVFSLIHLPSGTLGDVYVPVAAQLAGVHTTLLFLFNGEGGEMPTFSPSTDNLNAYAEGSQAYRDDS